LALTHKFDLSPNEAAEKFENVMTINADIGGGTIDLVRLQKRLENPRSREDFKTIMEKNNAYLKAIKTLQEEKMRRHFSTVREVEEFIVRNYEKGSYLFVDGKTGEKKDYTDIIDSALREYTYAIMPKIINAFPAVSNVEYKFNYFGGVAPILRKYIKEYVVEHWDDETFHEKHHIEPDRTARFLNLYGLEIVSRHLTLSVKS